MKDDEALRLEKERDRITKEVHAQLEIQANEYVQQQILLQQAQMRAEFEQQMEFHRKCGNVEMQSILEEPNENSNSLNSSMSQISTLSAHQIRMRNQKLGKEMRANTITTLSDR